MGVGDERGGVAAAPGNGTFLQQRPGVAAFLVDEKNSSCGYFNPGVGATIGISRPAGF
jgi:hypothetical protein